MRFLTKILLAAAPLALLAPALLAPALADDSSAVLGAGGIVLTKNADIRMATEDLYISPKQVKVHYTFVNDSGKDIDTIVAFPLPDVNNEELAESPVGTTVEGGGANFVGFKLMVDGKPVTTTPEEKAIRNGKDVTAMVRAAGVPLNVVVGGYPKLQSMTKAQLATLIKAGLIQNIGDDANPTWHALWTTTTKFWWKMHFPAGKTVTVDHTYQPVTGQTFFGDSSLTDKEQRADYDKNYCLDKGTVATIQAGLAAMKKKTGNDGLFNQYVTDFVIKTANNWAGPIGKFHLTVDKLKPTNILSMCWAGDLKKTGATRFESTLTNFAPKQDVRFLILETPDPNANGGGY